MPPKPTVAPDAPAVPTIDVPVRQQIGSEWRSLPCKLTPEEYDRKTQELAGAIEVHRKTVADHADAKKGMKELEQSLQAEVYRLRSDVANRAESRMVELEIIVDHEKNVVEVMRTDTGDVIESRACPDDSHKQTRLA